MMFNLRDMSPEIVTRQLISATYHNSEANGVVGKYVRLE